MTEANAEVASLIREAQAGNAGAWRALVGQLQRDVGLFIATFATSQAMCDEIQRGTWLACRDNRAACPATNAAATWARQCAMAQLSGAIEREAARAAAAGDTLSRVLAHTTLAALSTLDAPSNSCARQLSQRFAALDADSQALLTRRYGERVAVAALAGERRQEPSSVSVALFAARAACDWTTAATATTDALFASLLEDYLAGTISADSRGVIASCLAKDPRRIVQFERQVRLDLMLGMLLGSGDPKLLDAVAIAEPKTRGKDSSQLRVVAPAEGSNKTSKQLPAAGTRRRVRTSSPRAAPPDGDETPAPPRGGKLALAIGGGAVLVGLIAMAVFWWGASTPAAASSPVAGAHAAVPDSLAKVTRSAGDSFMLAEGHAVPAVVGAQLVAGRGLETKGSEASLAVALSDHGSLTLSGNTKIGAIARAKDGAVQAMLDQGQLSAELGTTAGAGSMENLVVFTLQGRVELSDGACTVSVRGATTMLEVAHGTAHLARADGSHPLTVTAKHRARIADQGDPQLLSGKSFARGINLGGDQVTIAGNVWLAQHQALSAGLTIAPGAAPAPKDSLSSPGLDFDTKTMLDSGLVAESGTVQLSQRVPDGDYALSLWLASTEPINAQGLALRIGGAPVVIGQPVARSERWWQLGPYPASPSGGVISLAIDGLRTTRLAGIEIDRTDGGDAGLPLGVALVRPAAKSTAYTTETIALQAEVIGSASAIAKVEYFDGDDKLGEVGAVPFMMTAHPLAVGDHQLSARVSDRSGTVTSSAAVPVTVLFAGGSGHILREYWKKIGGGNVSDLTKDARFPDKPDGSDLPTSFEGPRNWADDYGTRMRGWVVAPETGAYVFWLATDDLGELWLSSDDQPANKRRIAVCPKAVRFRDWTATPEQQSQPIALEAGKRYYIEALHKEGKADDHVSVGWQLPGGRVERPIPGVHLIPWSAETAGTAETARPVATPPPIQPVPTPAAPEVAAEPHLVKAINLGGDAVTIAGDVWLSQRQAEAEGLVVKNARKVTGPADPKPACDPALRTMLGSGLAASNGPLTISQKLANGRYQVYVWTAESTVANARSFDLEIADETLTGLGSLPLGGWAKHGPCEVTVKNGTLDLVAKPIKGSPQLMGLAIYSAPLSVTPDGTGWKAIAPDYQASIAADGTITSLAIEGMEFLRATADGQPPGFLRHDAPLTFTSLAAGPANSVIASYDHATVRYEFHPDGLTLVMTNNSGKNMYWIFGIDPKAGAAGEQAQNLKKTPIGLEPWQNSVWFGGGSRLAVVGSARVYAWSAGVTKIETLVETGQTRRLVLTMGKASPEEQKQAAAVGGH